jgi:hypothetical protein
MTTNRSGPAAAPWSSRYREARPPKVAATLDADRENGQQTVKAVKIAALDKPTAMAFGEDGALYVTVFDTAQAGEKPGKLLKFAPGL